MPFINQDESSLDDPVAFSLWSVNYGSFYSLKSFRVDNQFMQCILNKLSLEHQNVLFLSGVNLDPLPHK